MTPDINRNEHAGGDHATAAAHGLHVCATCNSALVYPQTVEEHGVSDWYLELRCPECGWADAGLFAQAVTEEFLNELNRGHEELETELALLTQANMADYVDRFVTALAADAIHPMDF
jgi:hypothetical protein